MSEFDTEGALNGAAGGAGFGAEVGGPWGALIGGVAGGLAGGLFVGGKSKTTSNPYADELSQISKGEWNSYISKYRPEENRLIKFATSKTAGVDAANRAQGLVDSSFKAQSEGIQHTLERQGVTLTPEQQAAIDRRTSYSKGLASIGAMNSASQATSQLQSEALTGGLQ